MNKEAEFLGTALARSSQNLVEWDKEKKINLEKVKKTDGGLSLVVWSGACEPFFTEFTGAAASFAICTMFPPQNLDERLFWDGGSNS